MLSQKEFHIRSPPGTLCTNPMRLVWKILFIKNTCTLSLLKSTFLTCIQFLGRNWLLERKIGELRIWNSFPSIISTKTLGIFQTSLIGFVHRVSSELRIWNSSQKVQCSDLLPSHKAFQPLYKFSQVVFLISLMLRIFLWGLCHLGPSTVGYLLSGKLVSPPPSKMKVLRPNYRCGPNNFLITCTLILFWGNLYL